MPYKMYFVLERMEPMRYPEPRDIKHILKKKFCEQYKGAEVSDIPYSTEIIAKSIKFKDPAKADHILLKYRVINVDWEELKNTKNEEFDTRSFRWLDLTEQNYEE